MSHFDSMYHKWVALDGTAAETLEQYMLGWTEAYKQMVEDCHTRRNLFLSNQSHNNRAIFENVDFRVIGIETEQAIDERRRAIGDLVFSVQQEIRAVHLSRWQYENRKVRKFDKACDVVWIGGNKEPTNPNLCNQQCEEGSRGKLSTTFSQRTTCPLKNDLMIELQNETNGSNLSRSNFSHRERTTDEHEREKSTNIEIEQEKENIDITSNEKGTKRTKNQTGFRFQSDVDRAHISLAVSFFMHFGTSSKSYMEKFVAGSIWSSFEQHRSFIGIQYILEIIRSRHSGCGISRKTTNTDISGCCVPLVVQSCQFSLLPVLYFLDLYNHHKFSIVQSIFLVPNHKFHDYITGWKTQHRTITSRICCTSPPVVCFRAAQAEKFG